MNYFPDRTEELASLERAYARPGAGLYILYGRRRLGKTTLLRRFTEGLRGVVYHVADRSVEADARRHLAESMARGLREPTLAAVDYPDWYALLAAYDRVRPKERAVLVIDEYQYLCEVEPAFSSLLQKWWDLHWSTQDILLVLCGSVLSMMYRETLARSSPLYGRRTGQWLLQPLRCRDVVRFFPTLSPKAKLRMWALTGGVPRYADMVSKKGSLDRALRECVLAKDGPLYAEARFLLQDEVSTPNVYWSLLHAIGSGVHRISEIAGRMSLPANGLTRYLAALQDLGLVRREVPVTEPSPERSKRGIYQVTDPFLHLWSGCVVPFESLLEFGKVKEVETLVRERLIAHQAWAFEIAAREYVENHAQDFGVVKVGRYWDRSTEVDVVGTDGRGKPVFAAECKWSDRPLGRAVGIELEARVARLWPEQRRRLRLAVVSSGGFSPGLRKWAGERGALLVGCEELLE